jgi:CelD/BcsL family acetyltransferase involved in cellulose biosynthesis
MINHNQEALIQQVYIPGYGIEADHSQAASPATVRIIQNRAGLDQVATAWDLIGATLDSPIQHHIWARACAETLGTTSQLHVAAVGPTRQPTALAPLIKRGHHFSRLEMIGVKELFEPMDFLYADPASLDLLAEVLARSGASINLGRVPVDSPVISAFQKAFRQRGWIHISPANACPYITLNADWTEPERQFNSGRRSDFRRAQRQAGQMGTISYEILSPTLAELEPLLAEAYRVEEAGWKGAAGSALALDPMRGAFYRRYAAIACEQGILRLCFLRIDGQAVAMQFAVECNDRFWLLKIGHDDKFARFSPGTLLMLHTVKYAALRGLASYEFLGSVDSWTQNWTQSLRHCVALRAYPFNGNGLAALTSDAVRYGWKRLSKQLRGRA